MLFGILCGYVNILKYVTVDQTCMRHVKPAVNKNITVFQELMPCSLVYIYMTLRRISTIVNCI